MLPGLWCPFGWMKLLSRREHAALQNPHAEGMELD